MRILKMLFCFVIFFFHLISCSNNSPSNNLAGNPTPDLVVTDIEVSQGTQNLNNDMPLVANRWTLVRVLVKDKNEAGAENVTARLTGFRLCAGPGPGCIDQNPVPLPVLTPWNAGGGLIDISKDGGSRVNLNDGFWFFLPKSWRQWPGTIQMNAEVNFDGSAPETLSNNNSESVVVQFNAADMLRVRAVPLHLHQDWHKDKPEVLYECSEPDFWDIFLNMFRYHPIDRMLVSCPAEPLAPFPHDVVPKEIAPFEWDMSDKEICGNANTRLKWLKTQENLPGRWQYAGLIHPSLGGLCNGWSGAANGDAIWLRMRSATGSEPWIINGGVTLAHELGHSHLPNPDHILCKGNEGPPNGSADTNYPYLFPNCRFSAANAKGYYGLDVYYALWPGTATGPAVLPNGDPNAIVSDPSLFPLMGYLSPRWTDPYTYCQLLNSYVLSESFFCNRDEIDPNPEDIFVSNKMRAAVVPVASALTSAPEQVLVSGRIDFDAPSKMAIHQVSRRASDEVFPHVLEDALDGLSALSSLETTPRFHLEVRAPDGTVLYSLPLNIEENHHEVPVKSEGFVELLAFPGGATTVALVDTKEGVETVKTATGKTPSVVFNEPISGTSLKKGTVISWTGRDDDSDFVSVTLRYSPDGGTHWHVIALDQGMDVVSGVTNGRYVLPEIPDLPGSTAGLLELVINDGFNTAITRMSGTVVVPGHPPRIVIHGGDQARMLNPGTPLLLSASIFDVEDGPISSSATLSWSLDDNSALLGQGEELVLRAESLIPGTHRLKVMAVDSDGMTTSKEITLIVEELLNS